MKDRIDLHTHTFFSDGELCPPELVNRAEKLGHSLVAITDHVGPSNFESVLEKAKVVADEFEDGFDIEVVPGVEITHVPPELIPKLAKESVDLGAEVVVVHGETIVEPVPEGTDLKAIECDDVDILAHPGNLSSKEAELAAETGTFLEISGRNGHSYSNGRVVRLGLEAGADFLVNTDAHAPGDLMSYERAKKIALGSGLPEDMIEEVLEENPRKVLE